MARGYVMVPEVGLLSPPPPSKGMVDTSPPLGIYHLTISVGQEPLTTSPPPLLTTSGEGGCQGCGASVWVGIERPPPIDTCSHRFGFCIALKKRSVKHPRTCL